MKKDDRVLVIFVAVCTLLQLAVAPNIAIGKALPNFLLIAVVCTAVLKGTRIGCITGFCAGILFDLISICPFGTMTIALTVVGYAVGYFARDIIVESMPATVLMFVVCSLFSEFLNATLLAISGSIGSFGQALTLIALPSALYDTVFALICFPLMKHFMTPVADRVKASGRIR